MSEKRKKLNGRKYPDYTAAIRGRGSKEKKYKIVDEFRENFLDEINTTLSSVAVIKCFIAYLEDTGRKIDKVK